MENFSKVNILLHPSNCEMNKDLDKLNFDIAFKPFPLWKRGINKIRRIINNL